MLMASTLRPFSVSSVMIVWTHSYRMAFPAFFAVSVLLATCQLIKEKRSVEKDKRTQTTGTTEKDNRDKQKEGERESSDSRERERYEERRDRQNKNT